MHLNITVAIGSHNNIVVWPSKLKKIYSQKNIRFFKLRNQYYSLDSSMIGCKNVVNEVRLLFISVKY